MLNNYSNVMFVYFWLICGKGRKPDLKVCFWANMKTFWLERSAVNILRKYRLPPLPNTKSKKNIQENTVCKHISFQIQFLTLISSCTVCPINMSQHNLVKPDISHHKDNLDTNLQPHTCPTMSPSILIYHWVCVRILIDVPGQLRLLID